MPRRTTAFTFLFAACSAAAAATCDGSSDPCTLDLGRVTVSFAQGAASYAAVAEVVGGGDGYAYASSDFLGSLQQQHTATSDGFSFVPVVYAAVGGSGINGYHEARGFFDFSGLRFEAKPGYRLDALTLTLTGTRSAVGDASATLGLPIGVTVGADGFAGSGPLNPDDPTLHAEFNLGAAYLAGDDGTALSYGTASSAFTSVRFDATVSAVPEPATSGLLLLGLGALAWRARRRSVPA